jgi:hypothetical protein
MEKSIRRAFDEEERPGRAKLLTVTFRASAGRQKKRKFDEGGLTPVPAIRTIRIAKAARRP